MQLIDPAPPEIRNHPLLMSGRIEAALIGGGKPEELKQSLNQIAKASEKLSLGDRVQVDFNLGMAYLRIGENQAAEQAWNQAAELQPQRSRHSLDVVQLGARHRRLSEDEGN